MESRSLLLRAEIAKNAKPLRVPLGDELYDLFSKAADASKPDCPFVFHKKGRPITRSGVFRAWRDAAGEAEKATTMVHDLCRTAVRNMVRSGTPERVAMVIAGRKTRSILDRYNIVSEGDLLDAQTRLDEYFCAQIVPETPSNERGNARTDADVTLGKPLETRRGRT